MNLNRIELGDIFELINNNYNIYFQCVEIPLDAKNEIELVKVFYGLHKSKISDLQIFDSMDFFLIRFPLKAALKMKILNKIGNLPLPNTFKLPQFYRTVNFTGDAWQIINAKTLVRETVTELSDEQKKLSPWGMMNDTLIIELLEKNWNLQNWSFENMW